MSSTPSEARDAPRLAPWLYYTQGSEAFKGDLYFYSVDHDLRDHLKEIDGNRCPVVMLSGEYDYLTPPAASQRTAAQIPAAAFIEMKEIGHFPMSENYPRFAGYLKRALAEIDRRSATHA